MKKSWKECLYDFCMLLPIITGALGSICGIAVIVCFLFELIEANKVGVLFSSFMQLQVATMGLYMVCGTIKVYTKETFLSNKVRNLLFADKFFTFFVVLIPLVAVFNAVCPDLFVGMSGDTSISMLLGFIVGMCSVGIPSIVSNHCEKKIVYIETGKE